MYAIIENINEPATTVLLNLVNATKGISSSCWKTGAKEGIVKNQ